MEYNMSVPPRTGTPIITYDNETLLDNNLCIDNESESDIDVDQLRPEKRQREGSTEEEEGWTEVKGKKKSRHGSDNSFKEEANYDVYISSKERLPKQFGMARILKELNIGKIRQVKYLSPFKIRLQFENESAAQSLFACEKILEKGWRLQKAMELSVCYGLIKNVDLDLSDDDILQNISSSTKLLSFKRLNRRNRDEGGWCPSETLRLCFEGDHLPATNPATNFVPKAYWSTELSHAVAQRRLALSKFRRNPTPKTLKYLRTRYTRHRA
ncbi:hypothetical protein HW555_000063 [Spodoptera exigua]|uniref:Uncharacterized protein n=1 Tax=Spodoptera exigua TaxID=7107 RepID=A0A835LBL8_SPOEX|nr:hypothetical protein HW555_000063 [Spodoptera exigua]